MDSPLALRRVRRQIRAAPPKNNGIPSYDNMPLIFLFSFFCLFYNFSICAVNNRENLKIDACILSGDERYHLPTSLTAPETSDDTTALSQHTLTETQHPQTRHTQ